MICRGDILLLKFPFTNLQSTKVRPVLVVSSDTFNTAGQDAIFAFITSRVYSGFFDLLVRSTDTSFQAMGLKVSSTIRVSKLMCLNQNLACRRLGHADAATMEKVNDCLKRLFELF
jgi:mRNA interferase MazF